MRHKVGMPEPVALEIIESVGSCAASVIGVRNYSARRIHGTSRVNSHNLLIINRIQYRNLQFDNRPLDS